MVYTKIELFWSFLKYIIRQFKSAHPVLIFAYLYGLMVIADKYKTSLGSSLVFLGAICFSAKAIMVKKAYLYGVDVLSILTLRMIFALPFFLLVPIFYKQKENYKIQTADWWSLLFLGLAGYYLASLFDFMGLKYISAGLERLILFIYPTIVVILSAVIFKTKIGKRGYLALVLTYIGIYIVFSHEASLKEKNGLLGSALIFASAFTYAVYLIGSGRLIPKFGSFRYTAFAMIVSTVAVLCHFFTEHSFTDLVFSKDVYLLAIMMAVVSTVIPSFLLSEGIRMIGSGRASIVASIGPVSTIVLAYFYLGESFSFYQLMGTIIVLAGVLIVSSSK